MMAREQGECQLMSYKMVIGTWQEPDACVDGRGMRNSDEAVGQMTSTGLSKGKSVYGFRECAAHHGQPSPRDEFLFYRNIMDK